MAKIRVLIAKPGLDGHDRGALVISQALRDRGMEVIYTGLRQSPVQIAQAAIQEDVDVVGVSSLSGAHNTLFPKIIEELKKRGAEDIPVIGGGVIPAEDIPFLIDSGIKKVFTSGASTDALANYIEQLIDSNQTSITPKKIAHIGIAVKQIDSVLSFYTDNLGLELEGIEDIPDEHVKAAFLKIGDSRLELLEPLDSASPIQQFLDKKGEGIHHIALEVDDIHGRVAQLKQEGVPLINDQPKQGAHNSQIAFIHPKAAGRVLFELCEKDEAGDV
ncbi:methylmalonyl-CoA epimerase [Lentibacillus saliphilus]|uniref:methylmalonyl-CoA epimerase n=1 Tax=Lentibacillus saliphilus TaxID=2737028 RepID=UPI001C309F8D|nr:methylmalonyl-CoA epimerase [Lentibacillus saliphilus]